MTGDTAVVFLPLVDVVDQTSYTALLSKLEKLIQSSEITALQRTQYTVQLEQLKAGTVPTFEFLHSAIGSEDPKLGEAYTVLSSWLLVCAFAVCLICP